MLPRGRYWWLQRLFRFFRGWLGEGGCYWFPVGWNGVDEALRFRNRRYIAVHPHVTGQILTSGPRCYSLVSYFANCDLVHYAAHCYRRRQALRLCPPTGDASRTWIALLLGYSMSRESPLASITTRTSGLSFLFFFSLYPTTVRGLVIPISISRLYRSAHCIASYSPCYWPESCIRIEFICIYGHTPEESNGIASRIFQKYCDRYQD